MPDELEAPDDPEDLYLARGPEVILARPLLTGDVLDGIVIPGLDDAPGLAIIVTHPCSMRRDGVDLADRLLTARVEAYQPVAPEQWKGHWKVMPLPTLMPTPAGHLAARLDKIGLVPSGVVAAATRIACLTPYGVNLLQQRFIWHLTRFCASTSRLNETCAAVFEEADLHEEWVAHRVAAGSEVAAAAAEFHAWIRSEDSDSVRRQERLIDPQRLAGIRREMRRELGH